MSTTNMTFLRSLLAAMVALTWATLTIALPLDRRAPIASDQVVPFAQLVPSGSTGQLYLAYQPLLKVTNGCVPFPAVDAAGNTNAGLNPSGSANGGCSSSTGQVYVRSAQYNGMTALMYSWYFPKDQTISGIQSGHRHDWEGTIVWLRSATSFTPDNIIAVCPSQHGDWFCSTSPGLSGSRPLIEYAARFPTNHALYTTSAVGGTQPLVAWESLPGAAVAALQNTDFGSATVPFKDATLNGNLAEAAAGL